jgi:hypothetical protein
METPEVLKGDCDGGLFPLECRGFSLRLERVSAIVPAPSERTCACGMSRHRQGRPLSRLGGLSAMVFSIGDLRFEIPDEWWHEAGMADFVSRSASYRPAETTRPVIMAPLPSIEVPRRTPGLLGLDRGRTVRALRCIAEGHALPPVPAEELYGERHLYMLRDGFHRYHASVAAGFTHLPLVKVLST